MSISHSHSLEGNAHGTTSSRKVAISSGIGATIEAYDFIGYGTAAALYFSTDFFPSGDPAHRHPAVLRHAGCRVRGPPAGRRHRRVPG